MAAIVYTAVFSVFGVVLRRPMILALGFGLGWEMAVSNLPGAFPKVTFMYYLKSLLGLGPEASGIMSVLIPPIAPASITEALEVLLVMMVVLIFVITNIVVDVFYAWLDPRIRYS